MPPKAQKPAIRQRTLSHLIYSKNHKTVAKCIAPIPARVVQHTLIAGRCTPLRVLFIIHRVPQLGEKGVKLQQKMTNKLIKHKNYIAKHGQDMPEILNWKWVQERI